MSSYTADDIRIAIANTYKKDSVVLFEVPNAVGFSRTRIADCLVFNLWPSRGLTLTGMEIKISRQDWKKELDSPEKADIIASYCDYWYLVTANDGVVADGEVPELWGWMELQGQKLITRKKAIKNTNVLSWPREFIASLVKKASDVDMGLLRGTIKAEVGEEHQKRLDSIKNKHAFELELLEKRISTFESKVAQFEQKTGLCVSPETVPFTSEVLGIAKILATSGPDRYVDRLKNLQLGIANIQAELDRKIRDLEDEIRINRHRG